MSVRTTGPQRVHKSRDTKLCTLESHCFCVFFFFFFFQAQNIRLCLEKLAHRSHVLTDPLNLSALVLPTCTQCVPTFSGHSPKGMWTAIFSMLLSDSVPSCTFGKLLIEDGRELVPCFRRATSRITRPLVR